MQKLAYVTADSKVIVKTANNFWLKLGTKWDTEKIKYR